MGAHRTHDAAGRLPGAAAATLGRLFRLRAGRSEAELRYLGANIRAHARTSDETWQSARAGLTRLLAAHRTRSFVFAALPPSPAHTLTPGANKAHTQPACS